MASVARRIVLTGSESTGKTTLAEALAAHYRVPWVPEFAREYAAARQGRLSAADVEPIALGQLALETTSGGDLVLDTDLLSTWIYAHHYYGSAPTWIDAYLRAGPDKLYLLCDTDLRWVPDPARDRGDRRDEIHALFHAELVNRRLRFEVIGGRGPDRLAAAIRVIDGAFPEAGGEPEAH